MLAIKFIRQNQALVKKAISNRGLSFKLDDLLVVDKLRSLLIQELEEMKANLNQASTKKPNQKIINELRDLKGAIKEKNDELEGVEKKFWQLMLRVPNIPHPDMPIGKSEADNVEIFRSPSGEMPPQKEWMKDHIELGYALDIIDLKQSAKVSGSRFSYLKNEAVILQDALYLLLRDKLLSLGFKPMIPPILIKAEALIGTSHFPDGQDQIYAIRDDFVEDKNKLYLVGSAEPSIFAYFMDKILKIEELPQKYFALTTCFRTEVGSWGKDVRGLKRVHQFDKLEMDVVALPEDSLAIMEELLSINKWFLASLELPFRIVNKCTGDSGYLASHKQYDVEVWLPSQKTFMEVMTNTNCSDFQARRLNIKYREKDSKKRLVHTVNDTGSAMGRIIISLLDNHQEADGSVRIPTALQPYTRFKKIEAIKA